MRFFHVTRVENLPSIMRDGLVPSIGNRSRAAKEDRPAVFLFASEDAMENALMNWLAEEFDDDIDLAILQVELEDSWNANLWTDSSAVFEMLCFARIGPEHIRFLYIA